VDCRTAREIFEPIVNAHGSASQVELSGTVEE
jgi:hypothetical protein